MFDLLFVLLGSAVLQIAAPAPASDGALLSLLEGRLIATLPRSAKIQPRETNIMAAAPSLEGETRVVIDESEQRFILMCYETMLTAGPDFEQKLRVEAAKHPRRGPMKVEVGRGGDAASPRIIRLIPTKFEALKAEGDAILLERMFVVTPDGMIQVLDAYVNAAGFRKNIAHWRAVVTGIRESLRPGPRRPETMKRTARIGTLKIDLPAGYILTDEQGIDFSVYTAAAIAPYGTEAGGLRIYLGHHLRKPKPMARSHSGTLFGETATWFEEQLEGQLFFEEAFVSHPTDPHSHVHVMINAQSEKQAKLLERAAATLRP